MPKVSWRTAFGIVLLSLVCAETYGKTNAVMVTVTGLGSVTADSELIECPEKCSADVDQSAVLMLNATPMQGQTFLGWADACEGSDAICILRVKKDINVVAHFSSPPAPVAKTGQSLSLFLSDDGDLQMGIPLPTPRFTDNFDGTVLDTLTGLNWMKDAGCLMSSLSDAFEIVGSLNAGADYSCAEYSPGSFNDWRLANIRELQSLANYQYDASPDLAPLLSNSSGNGPWFQGDPFLNVFGIGTAEQGDLYYSSTLPGESPTTSRVFVWERGGAFDVTGGQTVQHLWLVRDASAASK